MMKMPGSGCGSRENVHCFLGHEVVAHFSEKKREGGRKGERERERKERETERKERERDRRKRERRGGLREKEEEMEIAKR